MREGDVMAAVVITKVDIFVCGVWLAGFEGLGMSMRLTMVGRLVHGLVDNAVSLWKYQRAKLRLFKDDLPLNLGRFTCAVGSNSEQVLHRRVNDGPLRVQDGLLVATKVVIGEERFVRRVSHLISEERRNKENR